MKELATFIFFIWISLQPWGVYAPVPRCSPFIIINKLVEWNSLTSDSNPYFPVPPCEHGGPLQAIKAGDYKSVFLLDQPQLVPRHNLYELVWFLKTGYSRLLRMLRGKEQFQYDLDILREGYTHHNGKLRSNQLGYDTPRRPTLIEDRDLFVNFVGSRLTDFRQEGPDKGPRRYTPVGPQVLPVDTIYEEDPFKEETTGTDDNRVPIDNDRQLAETGLQEGQPTDSFQEGGYQLADEVHVEDVV